MSRRKRRPVTAAAVLVVLLMVPTFAQAAKKDVFAGPPRPIKAMPKGAHFAHFFPNKIKIARGDSIDFNFRGFHTITFLGAAEFPAFALPNGQVSGVNDAAGNPFWFNGQDRFVVNPDVAFPVGDGKVDNRAMESSGIPNEDPPPPYTLKFNRRGTFKYVCLIHPKMRGQVTVLNKGKQVPSARRDDAAIAKQVARIVKKAKQLLAAAGEGTNVLAGNSNKDLEAIRFLPEDVNVKVGQTVRWRAPHTHDFHTITFGPPEYLEPIGTNFIAPDTSAPQGGPPTLVIHPQVFYPSEQPPTVPAYDGANHGNGFFNSGIIDGDSNTPFPQTFSTSFPKAGTYSYLCMVHGPDMSGKVNVTA